MRLITQNNTNSKIHNFMVEARGIEPLSKNNPTKTSTCLAKMTFSPYFAHLPKLKSKAKT